MLSDVDVLTLKYGTVDSCVLHLYVLLSKNSELKFGFGCSQLNDVCFYDV